MKKILPYILLLLPLFAQAQSIPVHISDPGIYAFLDEMASEKQITLDDVVKPYSRINIAVKLLEINRNKLNRRQQKELDFYLNSFRLELASNRKEKGDLDLYRPNSKLSLSLIPTGMFYADSISSFALKPIWGIQYFNNSNGTIFHRWGGMEGYGTIKNFGFYANLRDNHETQQISRASYLNPRMGANYKGGDYSEMRGGITYANEWLDVGLVKDHFQWGTSHHGSNIFSGKQPSFAHLKLDISPWDWFSFHYVHGWLISNVIDSTNSYIMSNGDRRDVMFKKYLSANMFSFHPWKYLDISFGNAIVYSDVQPNPAYMIPFLFYKSVDHTYNSTDGVGRNVGQNSSMFYGISYRGIKHLHLYFTQFIDELQVGRITDPDTHNFHSTKAGFKVENWPIHNISFNYEYTRTVPITFQHDVVTTTYASNSYNLGHYLRDNAYEHFMSVSFKPIPNLQLTADYILAAKGEEYGYIRTSTDLTRHPFIDEEKWLYNAFNLDLVYQPISGLYLFTGVSLSEASGEDLTSYTPSFFRGKQTTFNFGFNLGF